MIMLMNIVIIIFRCKFSVKAILISIENYLRKMKFIKVLRCNSQLVIY